MAASDGFAKKKEKEMCKMSSISWKTTTGIIDVDPYFPTYGTLDDGLGWSLNLKCFIIESRQK